VVGSVKPCEIKKSTPGIGFQFLHPLDYATNNKVIKRKEKSSLTET
jgi:hypothetical protein